MAGSSVVGCGSFIHLVNSFDRLEKKSLLAEYFLQVLASQQETKSKYSKGYCETAPPLCGDESKIIPVVMRRNTNRDRRTEHLKYSMFVEAGLIC